MFDPEGSGPLRAQERHFPPCPGRRSDRWAGGGNRASVPPFSAAFVVNRVSKCDYASDHLRVLHRLTSDPRGASAPRSQARRSCRSVAAGRGRDCSLGRRSGWQMVRQSVSHSGGAVLRCGSAALSGYPPVCGVPISIDDSSPAARVRACASEPGHDGLGCVRNRYVDLCHIRR